MNKRYYLLAILLSILIMAAAGAAIETSPNDNNTNASVKIIDFSNQIVIDTELNNDNLAEAEIARSGCCSHHGGVCGCDSSTDRIICCDGTLSPSCKCSTY